MVKYAILYIVLLFSGSYCWSQTSEQTTLLKKIAAKSDTDMEEMGYLKMLSYQIINDEKSVPVITEYQVSKEKVHIKNSLYEQYIDESWQVLLLHHQKKAVISLSEPLSMSFGASEINKLFPFVKDIKESDQSITLFFNEEYQQSMGFDQIQFFYDLSSYRITKTKRQMIQSGMVYWQVDELKEYKSQMDAEPCYEGSALHKLFLPNKELIPAYAAYQIVDLRPKIVQNQR